MIKITVERSLADPAPAISAKVPIKVEMEHQGMALTFTASDAISAWDDSPEAARQAAQDLLSAMLSDLTADTPRP